MNQNKNSLSKTSHSQQTSTSVENPNALNHKEVYMSKVAPQVEAAILQPILSLIPAIEKRETLTPEDHQSLLMACQQLTEVRGVMKKTFALLYILKANLTMEENDELNQSFPFSCAWDEATKHTMEKYGVPDFQYLLDIVNSYQSDNPFERSLRQVFEQISSKRKYT
jgi:hypothetical protein